MDMQAATVRANRDRMRGTRHAFSAFDCFIFHSGPVHSSAAIDGIWTTLPKNRLIVCYFEVSFFRLTITLVCLM